MFVATELSIHAVSKLTNQWIELFRAGNHGEKGEFSSADLDQIVSNYKPDTGHEAPATIGHPTGAAPAYGWFGELKREGSLLLGKMREAQPEFEELVNKKLYKKRSVGLIKDEKGWALHHVAFLGAQPPHIKALADCKFEDGESQIVEVEFQENPMADTTDGIIARLNAWFEEKFPKKNATEITTASFSEADAKRIAAEAVAAAVAPLQAALDAQKVEFSERDKKLVTAETTARADAAVAKLKTAGSWVPAFDVMGLPVVFAELAKVTTVVEFGEGDSKKSATPLDTLVAFMEKLPKIVPTTDVYTGQNSKGVKGTVNFSESSAPANRNSVDLTVLAKERAAEKKIEFGEAMMQIVAERPELALPGSSAAGSV